MARKRCYDNRFLDILRAKVEADVRADTVQEMQERLEKRVKQLFVPSHGLTAVILIIDQVKKEMLEAKQ